MLAEQVYLLPTCVWKRAPGSHQTHAGRVVLHSFESLDPNPSVGVHMIRPEV